MLCCIMSKAVVRKKSQRKQLREPVGIWSLGFLGLSLTAFDTMSAVVSWCTIFTLCRKFYIVVDGGTFYSYETFHEREYRVYAPLAVFGEYYFFRAESVKKKRRSIQPSPYCSPRSSRPLPTPMYGDGLLYQKDRRRIFTVDIPTSGHRVINASDTSTSKAKYSEAGYLVSLAV